MGVSQIQQSIIWALCARLLDLRDKSRCPSPTAKSMKGTLYWGMLTTASNYSSMAFQNSAMARRSFAMVSTHLRASRAFFRFTVLTSSSAFLTARSAECRYRGAGMRGLTKNHRPQRLGVSPLVRGAFMTLKGT